MKTLIYKVILTLTQNDIRFTVVELSVKETPKSYYNTSGVRLSKDKLMKVDENIISIPIVSYHTFCLKEDIEKAKRVVGAATISRINYVEHQTTLLRFRLNTLEFKDIPVTNKNDRN